MPHRSRRFLRHGTLPQLLVLESIVRLGSFTRAAQELHMAQPTVSGLIRKLSEAAGTPLFEKRGRNLVPTNAGRLLHDAACEVLATLDRAAAALAAVRAARIERPRAEATAIDMHA